MIQAMTRLTLDMRVTGRQISVSLTHGDQNRRIEVTLTDGGVPFQVPPTWTAVLAGVRPSGNEIYNGCVIEGGKVIYDLASTDEANALTSEVGAFEAAFDLFDEGGRVVASPTLWVTVLRSARSFMEIENDPQFTIIKQFVKDRNEIMDGQTEMGEAIENLTKKVSTTGQLVVEPSAWAEDDVNPYTELVSLSGNVIGAGDLVLIAPEDDETKKAAEAAGLTVVVEMTVDNDIEDAVTLARAESGTAPTVALRLRYVVIHTADTELTPVVALVGVGGGVGGDSSGGKVSATGQLVVEPSAWAEDDVNPYTELVSLSGNVIGAGDLVLIAPEDDETKKAAEAAGLTVVVEMTVDNDIEDAVTLARAESGTAPTVALRLRYVVIHTADTELTPVVALVGVGGGVGGNSSGDVGPLVDRIEAIEDQLYTPISITSLTTDPSSVEKGTIVSTVTLKWATNKTPKALVLTTSKPSGSESLTPTDTSKGVTGVSMTHDNNVTWTLKATDERGATAEKSVSVSFLNRIYYGAADAPTAYNSAFVLGLPNKELSGGKKTPFTVTAGEGEYIFYCLPTSMGACTFSVGGFTGGFSLAATIAFENDKGHTENYYIYKSDNANLGTTSVTVK